jgi:hypothetical protein
MWASSDCCYLKWLLLFEAMIVLLPMSPSLKQRECSTPASFLMCDHIDYFEKCLWSIKVHVSSPAARCECCSSPAKSPTLNRLKYRSLCLRYQHAGGIEASLECLGILSQADVNGYVRTPSMPLIIRNNRLLTSNRAKMPSGNLQHMSARIFD